MKHSKHNLSRIVAQLMESPSKLLTTILMGNMFVNIASSTLAEDLFENLFPAGGTWLAVIIMTFLILIFGEITPKTLAVKQAEKLALILARPFVVLEKLLSPFRSLTHSFADFFIATFFGEKITSSNLLTSKELKTALDVGFQQGVVDEFEKKVIENVFKFGNRTIKQVFTPRIQTKALEISASYGEVVKFLKETGLSRIPIYSGNEDNILGVLFARDIILNTDSSKQIKDFLRPVNFVPETKRVNQLLMEFQTAKTHFAVVIDEYGVFSGVISMEDLLEEIMGEMADAADHKVIKVISSDEVIFDATMELDDFNERFDAKFEDSTIQSIGGYILNRIGRIPKKNDSFSLDNFTFKVVEAKPNKMEKLKVQKVDK